MTDDPGKIRERVAVLEANYQHMTTQIDAMAKQMDEVHAVLLKAKGAQWVLISLAMVIGFGLSYIKPLAEWLNSSK